MHGGGFRFIGTENESGRDKVRSSTFMTHFSKHLRLFGLRKQIVALHIII